MGKVIKLPLKSRKTESVIPKEWIDQLGREAMEQWGYAPEVYEKLKADSEISIEKRGEALPSRDPEAD